MNVKIFGENTILYEKKNAIIKILIRSNDKHKSLNSVGDLTEVESNYRHKPSLENNCETSDMTLQWKLV